MGALHLPDPVAVPNPRQEAKAQRTAQTRSNQGSIVRDIQSQLPNDTYCKIGKRGLAKARAKLGLDPHGNPLIDLPPEPPTEPQPDPGRFTDL